MSLSLQSRDFLDEYIGDRVIKTAISFMCIDTVLVALRFVSRQLGGTPLSWDDYLAIPALMFNFGNSICAILVVQHGGVGRHFQYVEQFPDKVASYYKIGLIAIPVIYVISACLPKVSILAVYLRIFVEKWSRTACYVLMFMVIANVIGNIPPLIYKCDPISYGWDPTTPGGWCADIEPRVRYVSLFNIITDVGMLVLPIPVIWKLHTNKSTKFGLACVFATGSVGLITSTIRFVEFFADSTLNTDGTWASVKLTQWTIIEPSVYLIAACLIAYRPLLLYFVKKTPISTLLTRGKGSRVFSDHSRQRGLTDLEMQNETNREAKRETSRDSDITNLIGAHNGAYFVEVSAGVNGQPGRGGGDTSDNIQVEHELMFSVDPKTSQSASHRL